MTKPITRKLAVDCLLDRFLSVGAVLECAICKVVLQAGDNIQFDHHHAIVHDGPHIFQNLRPVHFECHKKKTKADVQANAHVKRLANPKPSKRPMKSGTKAWPAGRKLVSKPFYQRKGTT